MERDNVRSERLGLLDRLRVERGRCPTCGGRLVDEENGDSIAAWTHVPEKYALRVGNRRMTGFPRIRNVNVSRCKRCPACERWYIGRWAYHEIEERPSQRSDSPAVES